MFVCWLIVSLGELRFLLCPEVTVRVLYRMLKRALNIVCAAVEMIWYFSWMAGIWSHLQRELNEWMRYLRGLTHLPKDIQRLASTILAYFMLYRTLYLIWAVTNLDSEWKCVNGCLKVKEVFNRSLDYLFIDIMMTYCCRLHFIDSIVLQIAPYW